MACRLKGMRQAHHHKLARDENARVCQHWCPGLTPATLHWPCCRSLQEQVEVESYYRDSGLLTGGYNYYWLGLRIRSQMLQDWPKFAWVVGSEWPAQLACLLTYGLMYICIEGRGGGWVLAAGWLWLGFRSSTVRLCCS